MVQQSHLKERKIPNLSTTLFCRSGFLSLEIQMLTFLWNDTNYTRKVGFQSFAEAGWAPKQPMHSNDDG